MIFSIFWIGRGDFGRPGSLKVDFKVHHKGKCQLSEVHISRMKHANGSIYSAFDSAGSPEYDPNHCACLEGAEHTFLVASKRPFLDFVMAISRAVSTQSPRSIAHSTRDAEPSKAALGC